MTTLEELIAACTLLIAANKDRACYSIWCGDDVTSANDYPLGSIADIAVNDEEQTITIGQG